MVPVLEYERVGLAEAKASLSSYVSRVERSGTPIILMKYNRPAVMIAPIPAQPGRGKRARGLLKSYADASKRMLEDGAFARAMEAKHARAS